jgi:hypothetical protein
MTQNFSQRTITCNNFSDGMKREVRSQTNIALIILMTFHKAYKRANVASDYPCTSLVQSCILKG